MENLDTHIWQKWSPAGPGQNLAAQGGVGVRSQRAGKDSDAGRDWGQEEKVTTEDEMAGWHH